MFLSNLFQKIKWDILAKSNHIYYIDSNTKNKNEKKFRNNGLLDFKRLVLGDDILNFDFNKVWEIGCGSGRMTEFFAEHFKEVIATDISPKMIKLLKKRLERFKNISTNKDDLFDIDFVFSYMVFHHFATKKMVIDNFKEIYRVLKNGGIAKIQVRGKPIVSKIKWIKWYYGVSFKKDEIENIVKKIGFKVLDTKGENTKCLWLSLKK